MRLSFCPNHSEFLIQSRMASNKKVTVDIIASTIKVKYMLYVFDRLQTEFLFHFVKKEKYFPRQISWKKYNIIFVKELQRILLFVLILLAVTTQSFDSVRGAITETLAELILWSGRQSYGRPRPTFLKAS